MICKISFVGLRGAFGLRFSMDTLFFNFIGFLVIIFYQTLGLAPLLREILDPPLYLNLIQFPPVLNSILTTDSYEHDAKRISFNFFLFTSSPLLRS